MMGSMNYCKRQNLLKDFRDVLDKGDWEISEEEKEAREKFYELIEEQL